MFNYFNEEKLKIDPKSEVSESLKTAHFLEFENLLQVWSKEKIMKVISWDLRLKLWIVVLVLLLN
jgi:phage terminase large subunit-like protein